TTILSFRLNVAVAFRKSRDLCAGAQRTLAETAQRNPHFFCKFVEGLSRRVDGLWVVWISLSVLQALHVLCEKLLIVQLLAFSCRPRNDNCRNSLPASGRVWSTQRHLADIAIFIARNVTFPNIEEDQKRSGVVLDVVEAEARRKRVTTLLCKAEIIVVLTKQTFDVVTTNSE